MGTINKAQYSIHAKKKARIWAALNKRKIYYLPLPITYQHPNLSPITPQHMMMIIYTFLALSPLPTAICQFNSHPHNYISHHPKSQMPRSKRPACMQYPQQ
jgi:hypothetical protein